MKKILCLLVCLLTISGCFKRDSMEDISIYTSIYPVRYVVDYLYGDNAEIYSIYPNGVNIDDYKLTTKQLRDYSNSNLFVFNSLDIERDYAVKMINLNKNLKIIDVALGMEYTNSVLELWLNPYNYLMMAQNMKNGLDEYITNPYLIKEIENNYNNLKLELSQLDAKIKTTVNDSLYKTIVVDDELFKFLEKYNLTIISLEETDNLTKKDVDDVKRMINNGTIKYIYTVNDTVNDTIKDLVDNYGIEIVKLNGMRSIDGGVTNSNENYQTIMNDNIDALKKELYK